MNFLLHWNVMTMDLIELKLSFKGITCQLESMWFSCAAHVRK